MAHWRIQIMAEPLNSVKWDELRGLVETSLTTGVFDRPVNWVFTLAQVSEPARGVFHGRFLTQTDADRVWTFLQKGQTQNAIRSRVTRAILSRHLCTHDDPVVQDCSTNAYTETVV